jgi:hypothetical protein
MGLVQDARNDSPINADVYKKNFFILPPGRQAQETLVLSEDEDFGQGGRFLAVGFHGHP